MTTAVQSSERQENQAYTHREILEVLTGLILALFVANLSGTIVSNALPVIIADLRGTQQQYTWIVTAGLLASTATTPIWGKLADLFDKKKLLQLGILVFVVGSLASGFASSTATLIGYRVIQGVGLGALMSLVQAIIGTIIPPRERGKYAAYMGASMAVATVVGPLLGGFIVDQDYLGWRWCFWSAVPVAVVALIVLQAKLKVPYIRRDDVHVDWIGATVLSAAVSTLLIWISFVDHQFAWVSWQTAAMVGGFAVLTVVFIIVENHVKDPIIPMKILCERTTALAVIASIAVGIAMFGSSVFLGQYFQIARGYTPTQAGLMTIPMMAGVLVSSLFIGRWVSKSGVWKPFVVMGSIVLAVGFLALAFVRVDTPLWFVGVAMAVGGFGVGTAMQNLVLAVQNTVPLKDIGSSTSIVTFFRSLGGAMGIQVLGAVFSHRVSTLVADGLGDLGLATTTSAASAEALDLDSLPAPVASVIRDAYGNSVGEVFLVAGLIAVLAIVAVVFMRGTRLRDTVDIEPVSILEDAAKPTATEGAAQSARVQAMTAKEGTHMMAATEDESKYAGAQVMVDADGATMQPQKQASTTAEDVSGHDNMPTSGPGR